METFFKEYVDMFKRWSDFEGKSDLKEFWMAILINFIISSILTAIGVQAIISIYGLIAIVPLIAVNIRRLHDMGSSGWNILWWLLPIIGWIIIILKLVKPSK
ncbi:MAG: DUF805 domain-containing protein [Candidatus Izimaplasma sp.]|nr:DUF805 domain-containing protein [Candidatus Izimaplasma bacterium]